MTNAFYNPSGNPGTGSEGLSALIRQEFLAVGAGFDALPAFLTTGNYQTTFNQKGNFTFDLPGFAGTLATLEDVDDEKTRALAAEGANTTAINTEVTARTTAVSNEVSRATTAENANTAAIAAEAMTRASAITTEATTRATGDSTNATAIAAEATTRAAADSTNATAIAAEATTRAAADSTNATAITTEKNRAEEAEGTNATAIAAETTRAVAAEATKGGLATDNTWAGIQTLTQGAVLTNNGTLRGKDTSGTPHALIGMGTDNKVHIDGNSQGAAIQVTPATGDDSTDIASTAFVQDAMLGGPSQTLQDLTTSRAIGTVYTNTTNRPIAVNVAGRSSSSGGDTLVLAVGSVAYIGTSSGATGQGEAVFGIVPPGETYELTNYAGTFTLTNWNELR